MAKHSKEGKPAASYLAFLSSLLTLEISYVRSRFIKQKKIFLKKTFSANLRPPGLLLRLHQRKEASCVSTEIHGGPACPPEPCGPSPAAKWDASRGRMGRAAPAMGLQSTQGQSHMP